MSNFNKWSPGELSGYVYIPHENTGLIPRQGVDNRYQELIPYHWDSLTKEFKTRLIPFERWWKFRLLWNLLVLRYIKYCQVNSDKTSLKPAGKKKRKKRSQKQIKFQIQLKIIISNDTSRINSMWGGDSVVTEVGISNNNKIEWAIHSP